MTVTAPRTRWLAMGVLCPGSFLALLDVTIVPVALPRIQLGLEATPTELQWMTAIHLLALTSGLLPMGRFGDPRGRKNLFIRGRTGITVASPTCVSASSSPTPIGTRRAQGLARVAVVVSGNPGLLLVRTVCPRSVFGVTLPQSGRATAAAEESGAASRALQAVQQIGAALGTAIVFGLYLGRTTHGASAAMMAARLHPANLFTLLGLDGLRKPGKETQ